MPVVSDHVVRPLNRPKLIDRCSADTSDTSSKINNAMPDRCVAAARADVEANVVGAVRPSSATSAPSTHRGPPGFRTDVIKEGRVSCVVAESMFEFVADQEAIR